MRTELTAAQHAVWFTEQAGVAGNAYQLALGIWFGTGLDERALEAACTAVVARHPALSTAVDTLDGAPALFPAAEKLPLVTEDLTDGRVRAELDRRFDLAGGPLARFTLLRGSDRHLLLVTAHHLVFDGESKEVLAHDLAAAYRAARAGEPPDLGPPPGAGGSARLGAPARAAPEADPDGDLARARAYWSTRWTPPGEVFLPDLRRVPTVVEPGECVPVPVLPELAARIDPAAQRLGITRFELLLAAVHVLLARYGNAGLPVGMALSTREAPGPARERRPAAREVGLFVNELPLAVAAAEGTLRQYALAVRAALRELYGVRAVPLAHAVGGLRPAVALTPVSVSYRRQPTEPVFPGVETSVEWSPPTRAARNALHLHIVDASGGLQISLQHSPDALSPEAAARIGGHLSTVLAAAVDDPDQPVATLPVLPPAERELVLETWQATARERPDRATVPELFAAQVRERPQAVAVVDGDRTLTYADLDAATGRLAAALRRQGAGPGTVVAVSLPRSWQAVAAQLAALRCGAAYAPVDPDYPQPRREQLLTDAAPTVVIADMATVEDPARVDPAGMAGPGPDDLAYVLYTSGSTGRPKGVAVPQRALVNLLLSLQELLGSGPDDRWLALTSLSFDISGVELFLPLVTGGRVVVASDVSAMDGPGVCRLVREQGVTHLQATPSGWRILLDAGFDGGPGTVAIAAGEALPAPLARQLRARVGRLINGYGPTENTIYSTMEDIPPDVDRVTIGRPLANTRAYLLDPAGQPVPIGIPGELHVAGLGVADGYLAAPDLTAERFGTDPFSGGLPGTPARCYRTGDRCRWLPDGRLEFLGRLDNQVKIRGHRVELGEIEARLLAHPAVAEAAVVLRDTGGDPWLVGYVVPRGEHPEPGELRAHVAAALPAAMVPGHWVVLADRLPRTPSGKQDRAALPDPPARAPVDTGPAGAETGGDELVAELLAIWREVLQVEDVTPDDDLFDLGGHSLSITRIGSRIHRRFGVEVPLDTFFDTPTVAEIADVVRKSLAGGDH